MLAAANPLLTVGELAKRLSQPVWRVEYLLRTRRVRPASRAGNARVFTEGDVDYLQRELRRIEAERSGC